jgi:flagellar biosynthesis/type III secretory pathway protein FliH
MQQGLQQGMQQGMQQGLQQGMQQGMQQGLQQGMQREGANLVIRLLNRRLGQVSATIEEQVHQLPVEQLENLGEALLDFESEADLLNWLRSS